MSSSKGSWESISFWLLLAGVAYGIPLWFLIGDAWVEWVKKAKLIGVGTPVWVVLSVILILGSIVAAIVRCKE
jgi:hypothetical protein